MSDDAYRPPGAQVADAPRPARGPVPISLPIALTMLAVGVILGVIGQFEKVGMIRDGSMSPVGFLAGLLPYAVPGFLVHLVARGRNWARIVVALCAVVAFASYLDELANIGVSGRVVEGLFYRYDVTGVVTHVLPHLANSVALVLLFWPARAWFQRSDR